MEYFIPIIILSFLYGVYFSIFSKNYRVHTYLQSEIIGINLRFKDKLQQYVLYCVMIIFFHLTINLTYIVLLLFYIGFLIFKKYDKSFKTFIIERYLNTFDRERFVKNNDELLDQL